MICTNIITYTLYIVLLGIHRGDQCVADEQQQEPGAELSQRDDRPAGELVRIAPSLGERLEILGDPDEQRDEKQADEERLASIELGQTSSKTGRAHWHLIVAPGWEPVSHRSSDDHCGLQRSGDDRCRVC